MSEETKVLGSLAIVEIANLSRFSSELSPLDGSPPMLLGLGKPSLNFTIRFVVLFFESSERGVSLFVGLISAPKIDLLKAHQKDSLGKSVVARTNFGLMNTMRLNILQRRRVVSSESVGSKERIRCEFVPL